jgi:fucose permease
MFAASCVALIVTAMSFAIRGDNMAAIGNQFHLSNEQLGYIGSTAFWGFTLAMMVGGPLCDVLGLKRIVWLAFGCHLVGIIAVACANGYNMLYAGTLFMGIGNGAVEAACNPLIATIYPEEKTKKLNNFHVWFPGGQVIGGLVAYAISQFDLSSITHYAPWRFKTLTMLVPLAAYGFMFLGQQLPRTERVEAGVSSKSMWLACINPLFLLMLVCMLMTASTELGPNSWIPDILAKSANASGILVLVWITGLMAVGRQFAGPVVHRLNPSGMLLFSAICSAGGLFWLSKAQGQVPTFAAATVFAIGVCYFWPTMIGFTSERCPRTGALGLALMGGMGMLSVSIVLPYMGKIYDEKGGPAALQAVGWFPVILIVIFGALWALDRAKGGYKAERIGQSEGK